MPRHSVRGPARARPSRNWLLATGLLCLACLQLLLAAQAMAKPQARVPHPLRTGVSFIWDNEEAAFAHVRAAGATLVQTPVRWGAIAPEDVPANWNPSDPADPNYDWSNLDLWVRRAISHHLQPVLQVRGAPEWAQRCPLRISSAPCDPDPEMLVAFTTAAVKRYSGSFAGLPRVRYWQGLNEPNLSLFFNPQYVNGRAVSPELFRVLINRFYDAVKAVDPSNVVIAGGLGPIAVPPHTIGPLRFTRELLCLRKRGKHIQPIPRGCDGGVRFDAFDIHPYTTGGPTHEGGPNDVQLGSLQRLADLLAAADRAGHIRNARRRTPLWITEFSWDSSPPDPGGLPMRILNRWTVQAMHRAWRAGVSNFFWFSIRDFPADHSFNVGPTMESGLYYRGATVAEDRPKPVLKAFRFPFVAYPRNGRLALWGRTPTSSGGAVSIQIRVRGRWRQLGRVRAARNGIFRGALRAGSYGARQRGAARAVYRGERSVPFSMRDIPDFRQPPFGGSLR